MPFELTDIDTSWTLFLDRDGVINEELNEDYVKTWDAFKFYKESLKALPILAQKFSTILIITNQKGVGKGLMTENELLNIHSLMLKQIEQLGGRIDEILYAIELENDAPNRKPQPGMAYKAKEKFPAIDFKKTIMVGNRLTDMQFGRNAGIHTVFLSTTHPETVFPSPLIDYRFEHLLDFAKSL